MNAKPLVIQGTEKIVAYACEKCGRVFLEKRWADECCYQYVCKYCGLPTNLPYRMVCDSCRDIVRASRATHIPLDQYEGKMVCVGGDNYIPTEYIESAIDDGEITTSFVWGCDYTPLRLDLWNAIENELTEHHEDAEFNCVGELEEFLKAWNAKQTDGSYSVDYKTVVVLDAARFTATLQEFEFKAAMRA